MRIDFGPPRTTVYATVHLFGLVVAVDSPRNDLLGEYLRTARVPHKEDPNLGFTMTAADLPLLATLVPQVRFDVAEDLTALFLLAAHPPEEGHTAALDAVGPVLWLRWFDGTTYFDQPLSERALAALVTSDFPFEAAPDAWGILVRSTHLPVRLARCSLTPESYIEIVTSKPQRLEAVPISGLWRFDTTRYGAPLTSYAQIRSVAGLEWVGPTPALTAPVLRRPPIRLSANHAEDLPRICATLAATGGVALAWDPGLGRRTMALAALDALDAWPVLIVSPPHGVWVWYRLVRLFGRRLSLRGTDEDARLITYTDLALGAQVSTAPTLIFDDLTGEEATAPASRAGLRRLDSYSQAYRIGISSRWPAELTEAIWAMDVVRPGEFRLEGQPLLMRYPDPADQRAAEHVGAYLMTRHATPDDLHRTDQFGHSQVRVVPVGSEETDYHEQCVARLIAGDPPTTVLQDMAQVLSSGFPHRLSKKVGAAMVLARAAAGRSRRTLILTAHVRTQRLIAMSLSGIPTDTAEAPLHPPATIQPGHVLILRWDGIQPGPLPVSDEVIVCDYPWSFAELERDLAATNSAAPPTVSVLHSPHTIDDRIAMYAASRAEEDPLASAPSVPEDEICRWLLRPRGL